MYAKHNRIFGNLSLFLQGFSHNLPKKTEIKEAEERERGKKKDRETHLQLFWLLQL